jgi:hypothetical protein
VWFFIPGKAKFSRWSDPQGEQMGESDARFAAAKLLDRRFFEYPHLRGKTNAAGDYEVHCNKCGTVDTYSFSGKNDVDAQSFALSVTARHLHGE